MIVVPEIILQNTMESALEFIKTDLKNNIANNTQESSWLYRIFNSNVIKGYDYFSQCKKILLREDREDRVFRFYQSFSNGKIEYPAVYINASSEDEVDKTIGGGIIGDVDNILFSTDTDIDYVNYLERRFQNTYEFSIVAENKTECLVLKNLVGCIIISTTNLLESLGLLNVSMASRHVVQPKEISERVFVKSIMLKFESESQIPELDINKVYRDAFVEGSFIVE